MTQQPEIFPQEGAGARPLIVLGMHRSGTSLLASLLASAGVDMGPEMLGADPGNTRGHFEDLDFLNLHKRALTSLGYGESGYIREGSFAFPEPMAQEARALASSRMSRGVTWGWKDPRTILFLPFWKELFPHARFVCIFRRPWEVVDSFLRRGSGCDSMLLENPSVIPRIWKHYNTLLLAFVRSHSERCVLFETSQVASGPADVISRIQPLVGTSLGYSDEIFDVNLLSQDRTRLHAMVVEAACPDSVGLYLQLRTYSNSGSVLPDGLGFEPAASDIAAYALREWADKRAIEKEKTSTSEETRNLRGALDTAHAALTEAHQHLQARIGATSLLERQLGNTREQLQASLEETRNTREQLQASLEARVTAENQLSELQRTWPVRLCAAFRR